MTKDEATALFERIYNTLKTSLHPVQLSILYVRTGGMFAHPTWSVLLNTQVLTSEDDWNEYKRLAAILETDEDLDAYADARRSEALNDLEQTE